MHTMQLDSRNKKQGAPTNSVRYTNGLQYKRSEATAFIFFLKKNVVSANRELIPREIQRHFEAWQSLTNATISRVLWIGDDLILATDSPELIEKWWPVERGYLEHMLGKSTFAELHTTDASEG